MLWIQRQLTQRRSKFNDGLPTTTHQRDGSSKAIRLPNPFVRGWNRLSLLTRVTYCSGLFFLLLLLWSIQHLWYAHASIFLTCHGQECELEISRPYHRKPIKVTFPRQQLLKTQQVKTDRQGRFIREDSSHSDYRFETYTVKDENGILQERKRSVPLHINIHSTGPDPDGHYDSFSIILENPASDQNHRLPKDESSSSSPSSPQPLTDLKPLFPFGTTNESGQFVFIFRQLGLSQSKRRVRMMVQKIESFLNQRRSKIVVQEETDLSWKGVVGLVVGLFGVLVTILFGQLLEEEEEMRLQTQRRQKQIQRQRQQLQVSRNMRSSGVAGPRRQTASLSSSSSSTTTTNYNKAAVSSSSSTATPRYSGTAPTQRKTTAGKVH